MVQVTDFDERYIWYYTWSFLASFSLCAITETSIPALAAIFLGYADVFTTSKALCGKNSSKTKKIGVKVDSRTIWRMEAWDRRLLKNNNNNDNDNDNDDNDDDDDDDDDDDSTGAHGFYNFWHISCHAESC